MRRRGNNFIITKRQILHGLFVSVLLYFVFHAIYGNRGILAYFNLNRKMAEAEIELDQVKAERLELEHKVKSLKTESLDADMLDEQARRNLGLASPTEQAFVPDKYDFTEEFAEETETIKER